MSLTETCDGGKGDKKKRLEISRPGFGRLEHSSLLLPRRSGKIQPSLWHYREQIGSKPYM